MAYRLTVQELAGAIPLAVHRDSKGKGLDLLSLTQLPDRPEGKQKRLAARDWVQELDELKQLKLSRKEKISISQRLNRLIEDEAGRRPEEDLQPFFDKARAKSDTSFQSDIGTVFPVPCTQPKQRDVMWIAGPAGSGKSTWICTYVQEWKRLHSATKDQVYLFSRKVEDPSLDDIKPKRIRINDELEPLTSEEFPEHSIIIFDDWDSLDSVSKHAMQSVMLTMKDLLATGRVRDLTLVITSHLVSMAAATRLVLNEATAFVVYPHGGSRHNLEYLLTHYGSLSKKQVGQLFKLGSRWVYVKKTYPCAIVYDHGAYLLDADA